MDLERFKLILEKIEQDCLKLKKEGDLTEFGRGQLELINIIKIHFGNG